MCRLLELEICVKSDEINYDEERFFSNEQELIEDYLLALYRNGQIYSDYNLIHIEEHKYKAFVNAPDAESISEKYNNEYVNRSYKHLILQIKETDENNRVVNIFKFRSNPLQAKSTSLLKRN